MGKCHYYVIGKDESEDNLTHYRVDRLDDIKITEQTVESTFGGINPTLYAEQHIYQKGENLCRFDIQCNKVLWTELIETFGDDITVTGFDWEKYK